MKPDVQLQQDVIAELNCEPSPNAVQIGGEVKDGIVALAGHIAMDVKLPGASTRIDTDIARSAENVLRRTTYVPKDGMKVMVESGWITLSGEVERDYQRQAAAEAVRYLMGVTGVSNEITIKPMVSSSAVKSDIEAALNRRAHVDAQSISVEVRGADVTLTGTVHSWFDRELATRSAWGTPGVRNVVDNISIAY